MSKPRVSVGILGVEDGPEAQAGAFVAASLPSSKFCRVGLATDPGDSGLLREESFDDACLLPSLADPSFAGELAATVKAKGLEVLLPGSSSAAHRLAALKDRVEEAGALICCADRTPLGELLEMGIRPAARRAELPVGATVSGPVGDIVLISSDGRRRRAFGEWERARAAAVLSDAKLDHVTFDPSSSFEVALVIDDGGRVIAGGAVRVLADDEHLRPWLAVTVDNTPLLDAASRLAIALDLSGPCHFLYQRRGTTFLALDAQPGFPLWVEVGKEMEPGLAEIAILDVLQRGERENATGTMSVVPPGILFSQTAEDYFVGADHLCSMEKSKDQTDS